jgi:hypothetical protein
LQLHRGCCTTDIVTRRRTLLMIAVFGAAGLAALHFYDPPIEAEAAAALADRMAGDYRQQSGQPVGLFLAREGRQWADGWEFRWRYRPCPEFASLRVWISRNGRRVHYAELPDCAPASGLSVDPLKT